MNADKQLNRIFRQAMRAEAALMQADELISDLCNSNAVDFHVASTLSHLLPRALPPVYDIIEYIRSIPDPNSDTKGLSDNIVVIRKDKQI